MVAKDHHSLWLNSAALALAGGDLEVEGGVVERDARGEPTGVLREEAAWRFQERHLDRCRRRVPRGDARRLKLADARGVTAVHDKDGWLGALRLWQQLEAARAAVAARLAVDPARPARASCAPRPALAASAAASLRLGYLKVFMDGTLGSQTAWMLDGSGRADHERRGAGRDRARAARRPGSRSRCTRSATARTARRSTRSSRRARSGSRSACGSGSSTRSCSLPRTSPRFAELGVAASVQFSHAPSDRDLADRFWAGKTDGAYAYRSLLDSGAVVANGSRRADRGARPARGHPRRRAADDRRARAVASGAGADRRSRRSRRRASRRRGSRGDERRRGTLLPGLRGRPRRARPRPVGRPRRARSSRRWSAAAGCTTRRPGEVLRALYAQETEPLSVAGDVQVSSTSFTQEDQPMKLRLLSTLALARSRADRGRGRRVGRRPGQALPVPRRAAQREPTPSPMQVEAATGRALRSCSARARTRRSRSARSPRS